MNTIRLLKYSTTNTYLIHGRGGYLLLDTGWAGTLPAFYRALGEMKVTAQEIRYVLVTHYHPDHMGIVQDIVNTGAQLVIVDVQREFVHGCDAIFAKEPRVPFASIEEDRARVITCKESRAFLKDFGIEGVILHSPGHSDDSISLWLDEGALFVGDLNPLYEREMHRGTLIDATWERLLKKDPKVVYYGHALPAVLRSGVDDDAIKSGNVTSETDDSTRPSETLTITAIETKPSTDPRLYDLVGRIIKYIDKGMDLKKIAKKTGADPVFVEDVTRMYLTHTNVGVQGILDRIEIKGK
ncbi:MAG: MBL fold metallo-hydrolase [Lachnospiraceae bacterium]|nr:MBL fold metallo-hydrolase [Lachnospiraceae bacterium]